MGSDTFRIPNEVRPHAEGFPGLRGDGTRAMGGGCIWSMWMSFLTKQMLMPNHFFAGPGGKALLRRYHRLWPAENDKGR